MTTQTLVNNLFQSSLLVLPIVYAQVVLNAYLMSKGFEFQYQIDKVLLKLCFHLTIVTGLIWIWY